MLQTRTLLTWAAGALCCLGALVVALFSIRDRERATVLNPNLESVEENRVRVGPVVVP